MSTPKPFGVFLIAVFFALATGVLIGVGVALQFPGSAMDAIWHLHPVRRAQLMPHRAWLGPGFLALAVAMISASIGCFLHRKWGWWLALAIFALNGLGDLMQALIGHLLEGGVGIAAAGALLFYLSRPRIRETFASRR